MTQQTIHETIEKLHGSLSDYIEATYHISAPKLIAQRQELLDRAGVIYQVPYLESTPRYQAGSNFSDIENIPQAALEAYTTLSKKDGEHSRLLYDPPYSHQAQAIQGSLIEKKNLVIMTGTGSGKTESFLLPILGKFAREAKENPKSFHDYPAMRALVLYPMNALVNDQLGRLRSLFGDPRLVELFKSWCGRPARFARYTSRTPYAGLRTSKKDSLRLKAFDEFYVEILRGCESEDDEEREASKELLAALKEKGKWPAKADLASWFGEKGSYWQDRKTGEFIRAVTEPDDTELVTRHEVQEAPADLLVTNYSMLEYMLMRPVERPIFDRTREWLAANKNETFLIVLDEAHLYRGAAGAEVGLLIRRLRDRLGVPPERFQVICATASFKSPTYAPEFGAQLSGLPANTFVPIQGDLALNDHDSKGSQQDAEALASVNLTAFQESPDEEQRLTAVQTLLEYRGVEASGSADRALYDALNDFGPMGRLVNTTMKEAKPIADLGDFLFSGVAKEVADTAVTNLMALGSTARPEPHLPGLLPCRIHNFFRGLPGLWVCMDPDCSELEEEAKSGICGKMYSQPHERCGCGARVLELFTCRNCGTAYARAYSDDVDTPSALWSEPGQKLRMATGETSPLLALDLLLVEPSKEGVAELADYDLETGRLNPPVMGSRMRSVYIRRDRLADATDEEDDTDKSLESRGQFVPCGVCGRDANFGRSSVQNHQTKGDQPFQALVARQIQIQPPAPVEESSFAPLQGRKVLAFSDSRQVAARLAPNLQMYSVRDSLRPMIAWGYDRLQKVDVLKNNLCLEDLYLAVLLASKELGVRLRPELKSAENFDAEIKVAEAVANGDVDDDFSLQSLLIEMRGESPPEALLEDIVTSLGDRFLGFEALALASLSEKAKHTKVLEALPDIPGVAETPEGKVALARAWIRCWTNGRKGFWLSRMPGVWWERSRSDGTAVKGDKGAFPTAMSVVVPDKAALKLYRDKWLPILLKTFTQDMGAGKRRLNGSELSLQFGGDWIHCDSCKSVHRPVPGLSHCLDCGGIQTRELLPDTDPVFQARKGYYRNPVIEALGTPPRKPMALIVAEHTAQLNAPQNEDVFSKAEENELLFQDIKLLARSRQMTAIDILSSTTTMEVGIDLGALSGVALRNMPPGRANYQQRAGRAGRRGNAVATVVAFGSSDSHDEHYFSEPDGMIRGDVVDPKLTLDNPEIVRRHIRAFLLQSYHQAKLPKIDPEQRHDLFSVLGTVDEFRKPGSILNRDDLEVWLKANESALAARVAAWIPKELEEEDRIVLLSTMVADCLEAIDEAIKPADGEAADDDGEDDEGETEEGAEEGEDHAMGASAPGKLLDRLLYCGKLPRYAFPTDVATFHVFDRSRSTPYRPIMKFAPSQGLPIALSQYAPGKQVWISSKCYTSGAIYSVMKDERFEAWQSRRIYMECSECGYARTLGQDEIARNDITDCNACGGEATFGPARNWMRPPGFAHPISEDEVTSPDDMPETSYATRAKLTMGTPAEDGGWIQTNDRIRGLKSRQHLLVSNTGPGKEGYTYCVKCGRIEASSTQTPILSGPHRKPYPDKDDSLICDGTSPTRHLVLGTDFITDIALFSLRVTAPMNLKPGRFETGVALRTVSEALAKAACLMLEIEPGELMAEYRPALTPAGSSGLEAEIFLYDTLPGGAGFSSQVAERGLELFELALKHLQTCPENCDASCYRCLRSFKNKFEHSHLDRHVGAELISYLLTGAQPQFHPARIKSSTELLANDLQRQNDGSLNLKTFVEVPTNSGGSIVAPILVEDTKGAKHVVALSGPLTTDHPADKGVAEYRLQGGAIKVLVENELLVRAHLPEATRRTQQKLRGEKL
ncbi:DUF1998 domain-containing protein [Pikeienuella piscinae]|uniref:DUF1998 domain-containing protein n=1 Tax=Pikeienuella piscinae TaxID=2748098 RepID=A0A7L5C4X6_9RHOB|nr:DEAD/DEAH box helicase [Pikeienuella piscinae]QIE57009.1 DUF1998 domain-containing protein [Pikeienuella piscinae]